MLVNGCDCSIIVKTPHCETDIPYSDETLREAVSLLEEEAAIDGDGLCKVIKKNGGATGCIITPLTISTAALLLYLAMGSAGKPVFVSGTRNLYKYQLNLLPLEDTEHFDLIQDRGGERRFFEHCRVKGFELRVKREEAVKLKLDICGERPPVAYHNLETFEKTSGERFSGDYVTYKINGQEYKNIYGITLESNKEDGTKTQLWIKRALEKDFDIPEIINDLTITFKLLLDKYESRHFGTFSIALKNLVLATDETNINSPDTVIGPLRYYVGGLVSAEVFTSCEETIK